MEAWLKPVPLEKVVSLLNRALRSSAERVADEIFQWVKRIKYEHLKEAIKYEPEWLCDKILFNHLHFSNPTVRSLAKYVLSLYWDKIQCFLNKVENVYNLLVTCDPRNKIILDTPRGRRWLNRFVRRLYDNLYRIAWS